MTDACLVTQCNCAIADINFERGFFFVRAEGRLVSAPKLIAATGSAAWPQCGADDSGLQFLRKLGHRIVPARPVLVPFVLPPDTPFTDLAGISVLVRVGCSAPGAPEFTEPVLFTHKGLSGPAVLQISCYWRKGDALRLDFLPQQDMAALLDRATGKATPASASKPWLCQCSKRNGTKAACGVMMLWPNCLASS